MSKYNLSCTIQNIQHIAIFGLLEIFFSFRGQNRNKNDAQNITGKIHVKAPSITEQSAKIMLQEKSSKIN